MDSIKLLETTFGHFGESCKIQVSTGETYNGIYHGYSESTYDNPLMLRLGISKDEANRIGVPHLSEIGICYDVIVSIAF